MPRGVPWRPSRARRRRARTTRFASRRAKIGGPRRVEPRDGVAPRIVAVFGNEPSRTRSVARCASVGIRGPRAGISVGAKRRRFASLVDVRLARRETRDAVRAAADGTKSLVRVSSSRLRPRARKVGRSRSFARLSPDEMIPEKDRLPPFVLARRWAVLAGGNCGRKCAIIGCC